jgi:hypothetical protein
MRMVQSEQERHGATTVWFSAWVYAQEQEIWAALLQSITMRLARQLRLVGKARFSLRLLQHSLVWDRLLYDGPKFVALVLFLALPAVVGSLLADRAGAALARLVNSAGIVGTVFWGSGTPPNPAHCPHSRIRSLIFHFTGQWISKSTWDF